METNKPLVSVCMITYNHASYLAQAIDTIVNQKTQYSFELVIGEDCSPADNTRAICEDYAARYPNIIRLLPSDKNHGMVPNLIRTYKACRGEIIAITEGDDWWCDDQKLEKQVGFLVKNPDFSVCYTDMYQQTGEVLTKIETDLPDVSDIEYNLRNWDGYAATSIVMRRYPDDFEFPEYNKIIKANDVFLRIMCLRYGKLKILKGEFTTVYRQHEGGVMATFRKDRDAYLLNNIFLLDKLDGILEGKYAKTIAEVKRGMYFLCGFFHLNNDVNGKIELKNFVKSWRNYPKIARYFAKAGLPQVSRGFSSIVRRRVGQSGASTRMS